MVSFMNVFLFCLFTCLKLQLITFSCLSLTDNSAVGRMLNARLDCTAPQITVFYLFIGELEKVCIFTIIFLFSDTPFHN